MAMEKRFDSLSAIFICILEWKNVFVFFLSALFGILAMEKHFFFICYSCLCCMGILAMEKQFDSLSAIFICILEWKNVFVFFLSMLFGILAMEKRFFFICYSCLRCMGILAREKRFDSLSAIFICILEWKNVFVFFLSALFGILAMEKRFFLFVIPVCVVWVFWQWKNDLILCLQFLFVSWNGKTFLCFSCLHFSPWLLQ
jgi:hypothetical protein